MQATKQGVSDRSRTDYAKLGFGGFLMGICEIIPGVSGGTMAFILGFYEEFISSLKVLGDRDFIRATFRLRIKEMFSILNWKFLLVLGVGMLMPFYAGRRAGLLARQLRNLRLEFSSLVSCWRRSLSSAVVLKSGDLH